MRLVQSSGGPPDACCLSNATRVWCSNKRFLFSAMLGSQVWWPLRIEQVVGGLATHHSCKTARQDTRLVVPVCGLVAGTAFVGNSFVSNLYGARVPQIVPIQHGPSLKPLSSASFIQSLMELSLSGFTFRIESRRVRSIAYAYSISIIRLLPWGSCQVSCTLSRSQGAQDTCDLERLCISTFKEISAKVLSCYSNRLQGNYHVLIITIWLWSSRAKNTSLHVWETHKHSLHRIL